VKTQRPLTVDDDGEHRVLQFRPRTLAPSPGRQNALHNQFENTRLGSPPASLEANDLARYEQDRDEPDHFRHRILANIAAFAFTVALTAIGIWLAMSISNLRRTSDCELLERHDCTHISAPHAESLIHLDLMEAAH
jgi:hypothetical protein